MKTNPNPDKPEAIDELEKIVTRLENAVEASTVARMAGRANSNRKIHANFMAEILALIQDQKQLYGLEARIDEHEKTYGNFLILGELAFANWSRKRIATLKDNLATLKSKQAEGRDEDI